jgi:phosphoribosylformylglycinamidine (FGAM) synthase-like enzyme
MPISDIFDKRCNKNPEEPAVRQKVEKLVKTGSEMCEIEFCVLISGEISLQTKRKYQNRIQKLILVTTWIF